MIHIRIDRSSKNADSRFACGIPKLPPGDLYFFEDEVCSNLFIRNQVDCPVCNPNGKQAVGTPLSELSGQPGQPGYSEFVRIAQSWGYP